MNLLESTPSLRKLSKCYMKWAVFITRTQKYCRIVVQRTLKQADLSFRQEVATFQIERAAFLLLRLLPIPRIYSTR
jgi:hypothetical protein